MAHSYTIVAEDKSKRILTNYIMDGVVLTKSDFLPGYWYIMDYPETLNVKDLTSQHVVVRGVVKEVTGTLPDLVEGHISTKSNYNIEAGQYRRETIDGCEMWCPRSTIKEDLDINHVQSIKLEPNESITIPIGNTLFVAEGDCLMGTRKLTEEKFYRVETQPKTLIASTRVYLFYWIPKILTE